jgi:hypothetical protein
MRWDDIPMGVVGCVGTGERVGWAVLVNGGLVGLTRGVMGMLLGVEAIVSGSWQARLVKMSRIRMVRRGDGCFEIILVR